MKRIIETQLWSFGFLPLLLVMEILEDEGEYEMCQIILDVLKDHGDKYEIDIPTRFTPQAVAQIKIGFMVHHGLSGDIAYQNNAYYAQDILRVVEAHRPLNDFNSALKKCLTYNKTK